MSNINNYALKQNTILYGKSHTYTIEKILGQGSFGITYLAMTQVKVSGALGELETTIQVAIKEFFMKDSKHSKKCTFYTLRFGCSFAAVNTIKPQLL